MILNDFIININCLKDWIITMGLMSALNPEDGLLADLRYLLQKNKFRQLFLPAVWTLLSNLA